MDCCDDRSACRRSTAVFLLFVVISLLASSPLARSRQTITTVAPICASASAVAFPIPELAPVTMQIFPCILLFTVGMIRSFFKFSYDVFLSHRIPVFLHQTPVVRATARCPPAAIGFDSGSSTFWSVIFLQAVLFFHSASSRQVQRCVRCCRS